jgi:hypothetical protein
VHQSVCRLPGQFDAPESPEYCVYTPKEKGAQGPLSQPSFLSYQAPDEPKMPNGSDQPKL